MITIELITQQDEEYEAVCITASRIYWEKLGVTLSNFPPTFIEMFEDGVPVGGCGLRYGAEEPLFSAEKYCDGTDLSAFFPESKIPAHSLLGEICCGHLGETHHQSLSLIPPPNLFEYAHTRGLRFLFVTSSLPTKRLFSSLKTRLISVCEADINKAGYSPVEYKMWERKYFKLKPEVCLIDVEQALQAYHEKQEENPAFLPPFIRGERLATILDTQRVPKFVAARV